MGRGDLVVNTFICPICKRKRQGKPPVCGHCQKLQDMKKINRLVTVKTVSVNKFCSNKRDVKTEIYFRSRSHKYPTPHPKDLKLLQKLNGGEKACSTLLYTTEHDKRHGKCSCCQKYFPTMRIVLRVNNLGVRGLFCEKCFNLRNSKRKEPLPFSKNNPSLELMWQKADPMMKLLLTSNPTFVRELALTQPLASDTIKSTGSKGT